MFARKKNRVMRKNVRTFMFTCEHHRVILHVYNFKNNIYIIQPHCHRYRVYRRPTHHRWVAEIMQIGIVWITITCEMICSTDFDFITINCCSMVNWNKLLSLALTRKRLEFWIWDRAYHCDSFTPNIRVSRVLCAVSFARLSIGDRLPLHIQIGQ